MTGGRKRAPNTLGPHFLRSWRGPSHRSHGVVAPDVHTVLAVNGSLHEQTINRQQAGRGVLLGDAVTHAQTNGQPENTVPQAARMTGGGFIKYHSH